MKQLVILALPLVLAGCGVRGWIARTSKANQWYSNEVRRCGGAAWVSGGSGQIEVVHVDVHGPAPKFSWADPGHPIDGIMVDEAPSITSWLFGKSNGTPGAHGSSKSMAWWVSGKAIASPVTYGTLPDGAHVKQPAKVLRSGQKYSVMVFFRPDANPWPCAAGGTFVAP